MYQVMSWLPEITTGDEFWVGGKDIYEEDNAVWVANGWNILGLSWAPVEPNYLNGDCVLLEINHGLAVGDCDDEKAILCQLYD